jgi:hypothetical protein
VMDVAGKHTIHCRDGGKVVLNGDEVEVYLPEPIRLRRKRWIHYISPRVEVSRSLPFSSYASRVERMLEEAFTAVPMKVYPED